MSGIAALIALLVLTAGPVWAIDWDGSEDNDWHNGLNWDGDAVPTILNNTYFRANGLAIVQGDATNRYLSIAHQNESTATVSQESGSTMTIGSAGLFIGYEHALADGYYYMNGARLTNVNVLTVGSTFGAHGTMSVTNSRIDVLGGTSIGKNTGHGVFRANNSTNMFAGVSIGNGTGSTGEVRLVDSTLVASGDFAIGSIAGSSGLLWASNSHITCNGNYQRWGQADVTLIDCAFTNTSVELRLGQTSGSICNFRMVRGNIVTPTMLIGTVAGAAGHVYLNDTTATIADSVKVGNIGTASNATFSVNGGDVTIVGDVTDSSFSSTFEITRSGGTFTCNRFIFNQASSTTRFWLEGSGSSGTALIDCSGASTIAGTLEVGVTNGFSCALDDTFTLMKVTGAGINTNGLSISNLVGSSFPMYEFGYSVTNLVPDYYLSLTCTNIIGSPATVIMIQ
jgi:hypothetical protein